MRKLALYIVLTYLLSACSEQLQYPAAENFTLKDSHSNSFQLSDYKGKAVVVIFWASWCPYCAKIMPALEQYYQTYNNQGLEIIAVNINEDGDPIAHMKQKGFHYRLGLNGDAVAEQWNVSGTPTLVFINREGNIIGRNQISDPKSSVIKRLIEQILEN